MVCLHLQRGKGAATECRRPKEPRAHSQGVTGWSGPDPLMGQLVTWKGRRTHDGQAPNTSSQMMYTSRGKGGGLPFGWKRELPLPVTSTPLCCPNPRGCPECPGSQYRCH